MKIDRNIPLALVLGGLLVACGGGGTATSSNSDSNTASTGSTTTAVSGTAPNISAPDGARLLASQCFQCHGMNGISITDIDSIAGDSAAHLVEEML